MNWIKCSDRLPKEEKDVLFHDNTGNTHKGWHSIKSKGWFIDTSELSVDGNATITDDFFESEYITHWQELPPKPQDRSKDND